MVFLVFLELHFIKKGHTMAKPVELTPEAIEAAEGLCSFVAAHGGKTVTLSDVIQRSCNTVRQSFEKIETKA